MVTFFWMWFIIANLRYLAKNLIFSWWMWTFPLIAKDERRTNYPCKVDLVILVYDLVMTNSSPWKINQFLRTVNHLFRLGPSIPWQTVSHSQRVSPWKQGFFIPQAIPTSSTNQYQPVPTAQGRRIQASTGGTKTWRVPKERSRVPEKLGFNDGNRAGIEWEYHGYNINIYNIILVLEYITSTHLSWRICLTTS